MKLIAVVCGALLLSGCVSTEVAHFKAQGPSQQAIVRDGRNAIVSKKKNSIVLVSPASRQFGARSRPVYVVAMTNLSRGPLDFHVSDVTVTQTRDGTPVATLPVITYEQLVSEERSRQVAAALLIGLAAGANAAAAANAGYGHSYGTVVTPRGNIATYSATTYNPGVAAFAQANAAAENAVMIDNAVETGRRNLAALEQQVIKDNTLMPGEWYGGQLHFAPPQATEGKPKTYTITIRIGDDVHEIEVVQAAPAST